MAPCRKPTGFMTNPKHLAHLLSDKCDGKHRHAVLLGGKSTFAEVYPIKLSAAILRGMVQQLREDGKFDSHSCLFAVCEEAPVQPEYYDDVTNLPLDPALVRQARADEMAQFRKKNTRCTLRFRLLKPMQ